MAGQRVRVGRHDGGRDTDDDKNGTRSNKRERSHDGVLPIGLLLHTERVDGLPVSARGTRQGLRRWGGRA
jgi:hypothetical protein